MDHFPDEITTEILSRLHVQSLLRARSLCKGVHALTHDPIFVDKHLKVSSQRNLDLIITDNRCRENGDNLNKLYYVQNEETSICYSCRKVSLEIPNFKEFRVMGSCNGLICLVNPSKRYEIYVCNPCTGKYAKVPPPVSMSDRPGDIVIGFGVIPMTNKYKVLAIVDFALHGDFDNLQQKVFVYTLGDTTWIPLKDRYPVMRLGQSDSACKAFVNGALHWVSDAKLIVSFSMVTEEFNVIPRPELELGSGSFTLRAFQGKLAILNTSFGDRIEIWVMESYGVADSWTHRFTINQEDIGLNIRDIEIGCFLKDWEVLMVYNHRALLRYNLQTAFVVEVNNIDSLPERFQAIAHVGTLVSPLIKGDGEMELDEK